MIMNCLKNKKYYKVGGLGQEMALNKNKQTLKFKTKKKEKKQNNLKDKDKMVI